MAQKQDWLLISILTFITVVAWIVFDVYHAAVTSTVTDVQQVLIRPLSPKINESVIEHIRTRIRNN